MEHIIKTDLADGYVRLTPEKGYELYSITLQRVFSEAIVKADKAGKFVARKIETETEQ